MVFIKSNNDALEGTIFTLWPIEISVLNKIHALNNSYKLSSHPVNSFESKHFFRERNDPESSGMYFGNEG